MRTPRPAASTERLAGAHERGLTFAERPETYIVPRVSVATGHQVQVALAVVVFPRAQLRRRHRSEVAAAATAAARARSLGSQVGDQGSEVVRIKRRGRT